MDKKLYLTLTLGILVVDGSSWYSATVGTTENLENMKTKSKVGNKPIFQPSEIDPGTYDKDKIDYGHFKYLPTDNILKTDAAKFQPSTNPIYFQKIDSVNVPNENINLTSTIKELYFNNPTDINKINTKQDVLPKFREIEKQTQQQRFLEVFEVVEFDHVSCTSTSGLEGTCLHEYNCQNIGGLTMGSCADGFGACCVITFNCDTRSASPVGWFISPGYPSPSSERLSCSVTIEKASEDIKQIRLDFMNFEILPPTYGTCEEDQFLVTGQNLNNVIPILCGINTGQHVYIEVGNSKGPINLSVQTLSAENRIFAIKVSQITSSDKLAAPTGCLQYFTESYGYLESFNYRDRSEIGINRANGYLNNLNYAVCIEREPSSCSITYTNVGEMQIVNYDTDGLPTIPPRQAGVEIFNCPSDWLLIAAVRLCGERLNDGSIQQDFSLDAPVIDDGAGPIIVWFRTDGIYAGRGYKLLYQQNGCSSANKDQ